MSKYSKALLIVSNLIFENLQPVTSTIHYIRHTHIAYVRFLMLVRVFL